MLFRSTSSSSPPRLLRLTKMEETESEVSWDIPLKAASDLSLKYNVKVFNDDCTGLPIRVSTLTEKRTNIDSLEPSSLYCVSVKAVNDRSSYCFYTNEDNRQVDQVCIHDTAEEQIFVTTATSPPDGLMVTATTTDSVTLTWEAPRLAPTATFKEYVVDYTTVDSKTKQTYIGSRKSVR